MPGPRRRSEQSAGVMLTTLLPRMLVLACASACSPSLIVASDAASAPAPPAPSSPGANPALTPAQRDAAMHAAAGTVGAKQREIDHLAKAIASQQKAIIELQSRQQELNAAYADLVKVMGDLPQAKAVMDAANQKVYDENQANHNYNTNSGGASADSVKAQQDAQQRYEKLRGEAADAPAEMDQITQNLHAATHDSESRGKRVIQYQKEEDAAQAELDMAMEVLARLQAPAPAPAPTTGPTTAPAIVPVVPPAVPAAPSQPTPGAQGVPSATP
jgi:hypothetical protein